MKCERMYAARRDAAGRPAGGRVNWYTFLNAILNLSQFDAFSSMIRVDLQVFTLIVLTVFHLPR